MTDPTQRFSIRVENYIKYRPDYPKAVVTTLQEECQLTSTALIADIGSGTGLLTELFLQNGNIVFAVEPNLEMRSAGERILQNYFNFHSVNGKAESTTLAEHSIDFIVAGQAFHWFDVSKTRAEFLRILKPGSWVVLVWNDRETKTTPFLIAYEQLLQQYATDYAEVNHKQFDDAALGNFYGSQGFKLRTFGNQQNFDLAGVQGRLLSSSYAPETGHPNHEPMLIELANIFHNHEVNGHIEFEYTTKMYLGKLS